MNYRQHLDTEKGKLQYLVEQKHSVESEIVSLKKQIEAQIEARDTVNNVLQATQISFASFLEEVVTLGLRCVFGPEYAFKVEYRIQRNKSEALLYVVKNGELLNAEDSCGGGILDVTALTLRAALFALADPKPEGVFLLDEPGRFVSRGECTQQFGKMLKELSELLKIQIIMVTHEPALIESADKAFRVSQVDGVSSVEVVQ